MANEHKMRTEQRERGAIELRIAASMWHEIRDYLFSDDKVERVCYLMCGKQVHRKSLTLLGCYLVIPEHEDYEIQTLTGVKLRPGILKNILVECERLNLSLIDIHSHPFSDDYVSFSSTDDNDEREKAEWISKNMPNVAFGSMVLAKNAVSARLRAVGSDLVRYDLNVKVLKPPLTPRGLGAPEKSAVYDQMVDRHVRAFGRTGQKTLSRAKVGVIGLGGLGSTIAQGLARLGVGSLYLVDGDRVDASNLNRLAGSSMDDVASKRWKTHVARREVRRISSDIVCETSREDITKRRAWRRLLDCDLIITTTDNNYSRLFLNILTHQYLIPQISVGALIDSTEDKLLDVCGHVRVLVPGEEGSCMVCSGIIDPVEAYYEMLPLEKRVRAAQLGYIRGQDNIDPAVVHLNGVLSNMCLLEAHNIFLNFKTHSKYLHYDALTQELFHVKEDVQGCSICAPNGGLFGRGDLEKIANYVDEAVGI